MDGKTRIAVAALLAACVSLGAVALGAAPTPDPRRGEWREGYRTPEAIPFPDDNPYTAAKAELGRRLFFDTALSGDGTRACVTCHLPDLAWADGRARALKRVSGTMALRTPTLLNIAWQDGRTGWDGKFPSVEAVAAMPMQSPTNMNLPMGEALARLGADPDYTRAFALAFGDPAVTRERLEAALATFQRLIVSGPGPFDRWVAGDEGAVSEAAKRGFDLFNGRANCAACHGGWSFTDGSFHDIGTATGEDVGRGRYPPVSVALRYAFKTPGLREIGRRGPYMHDGSLPSLEAVVEHYDRGGIDRPSRSRAMRPLNLTADERADLVAFLHTLTADSAEVPALDDFGPAPPVPEGPHRIRARDLPTGTLPRQAP